MAQDIKSKIDKARRQEDGLLPDDEVQQETAPVVADGIKTLNKMEEEDLEALKEGDTVTWVDPVDNQQFEFKVPNAAFFEKNATPALKSLQFTTDGAQMSFPIWDVKQLIEKGNLVRPKPAFEQWTTKKTKRLLLAFFRLVG